MTAIQEQNDEQRGTASAAMWPLPAAELQCGWQVKQRFEAAGGTVLEFTGAQGVAVHPNGVSLDIPTAASQETAQAKGSNGTQQQPETDDGVTGRLLIDCMGNFSPIVRQARWGQRPDGVCLVVGTCSRGFQHNTTGALLSTHGQDVILYLLPASPYVA